MNDFRDLPPIHVPPVVLPGQHAPESAYRVAHDLLARRAPVEALSVLEPALEVEPRDRGLRSLKAWALMIRAQLAKAEAELRGLVDDDPSDDWARHALGRTLERRDELSEALPHLRLAHAMSGDAVHGAAARRVELRLQERDARAGGA